MGTQENSETLKSCHYCGQPTSRPKFCSHKCKLKDYMKRAKCRNDRGKCVICGSDCTGVSFYCGEECQKKAYKDRIEYNKCLNCGSDTRNELYCSLECRRDHYTPKLNNFTCKFCQKEFQSKINRDYCSTACKERKFTINEDYFEGELTESKLETLGQIIGIGQIYNKNKLKLRSDLKTLQDISAKMESNQPFVKGKELYSIIIHSEKLVYKLLEFGLIDNKLKQEYPPYNIMMGLFKTHLYKSVGGGWNVFRTVSEKLANELEFRLNGKIVTKTYYVDVTLENLGVEFFVIWNDDPSLKVSDD